MERRQTGEASCIVQRFQRDGAVVLVGKTMRFRIERLKPGVVLATGLGSGRDASDRDVEAAMLEEFDKELKSFGSLTLFADTRGTPRISPGSRELAAAWARENKDRITMTHVLVDSKLVEMAIAVIRMVTGNQTLRTYSDPEVFLAEIRRLVPGFSTLPNLPPDRPHSIPPR